MSSIAKSRRRSGGVILLTAAAALAVIILAGSVTGAVLAVRENQEIASKSTVEMDMLGQPVQLEDPVPLPPEASPTPSGFGRFQVSSVKLDVPLGAVNVARNQINPPGLKSVYWIRNLGVPLTKGSQGTVFLATHSLRGGGQAPGNYLLDVERATTTLKPGAEILVDNVKYRFTRSEVIDRVALSQDAEFWESTPGRLVVLTCLQRPDQRPASKILVIEAAYG